MQLAVRPILSRQDIWIPWTNWMSWQATRSRGFRAGGTDGMEASPGECGSIVYWYISPLPGITAGTLRSRIYLTIGFKRSLMIRFNESLS